MELLCPICSCPLQKNERTYRCVHNHCFDLSKDGYINLLIRQSVDHGDNKEMVIARTQFLESGPYDFLRRELVNTIQAEHPEVLADLGCGEGYYTSRFPSASKYGFDMSKEALKHASRTDKSTLYAVSSIFRLPVTDASVDTAVTCFAPAATEEIQRILKPGGCFIFVTPGPKHLFELKELLYEHPYLNAIKQLDTELCKEREWVISQSFHADQKMMSSLFEMTPYAHKTGQVGQAKMHAQESLDITAEFVIRIYRKC